LINKLLILGWVIFFNLLCLFGANSGFDKPIVDDTVVFEEKNGLVADGKEHSRAYWAGTAFAPEGKGEALLTATGELLKKQKEVAEPPEIVLPFTDPKERLSDGNGSLNISGQLKQWHKITLDLNGPFAHELDTDPNPFTDYNLMITFEHESGEPILKVPGYYAADGNSAETSADRGTIWRTHFSPTKTGVWNYIISFLKGSFVAISDVQTAKPVTPFHGKSGKITVSGTDKKGHDLRAKGRLQYVGKHHLQFAGSKDYFLKAGADAPETFLAYADFDATYTLNNPLKTWEPHIRDWNEGDPVWQDSKGKGIIGAINYLSEKGVNAFSFLTYNAGGDGDNVWPFIKRNEKFHYDCSKLDQWQIVFDHAQKVGLYLHFKTQETENDDNIREKEFKGKVPESLDDGNLGPERKLYYRELIARFGYLLALNWNLGEENTQTTENRKAMAAYFAENDPYKNHIVIHNLLNQQDNVYTPLLGAASKLTGVSLQNDWDEVHHKTLQWVKASAEAGKPWVVANDEQGSAAGGVPPDPGYRNYKAETIKYDIHDVRKQVLWANLMAGGAGVEYYFGYELPENDLVCEDYRSRDKSWDFCRIALNFFQKYQIPFEDMINRNDLIANGDNNKEKFCLVKEDEAYLIYLAYAKETQLDLSNATGNFDIYWYNPRKGDLLESIETSTEGGKKVHLGPPPEDLDEDWLIIVIKNGLKRR